MVYLRILLLRCAYETHSQEHSNEKTRSVSITLFNMAITSLISEKNSKHSVSTVEKDTAINLTLTSL